MLSAKRDVSAAKRFFKKLMKADHRRLPFTIGTDKHASYPEAFAASIKEKVLPPDCKLRRVKYHDWSPMRIRAYLDAFGSELACGYKKGSRCRVRGA